MAGGPGSRTEHANRATTGAGRERPVVGGRRTTSCSPRLSAPSRTRNARREFRKVVKEANCGLNPNDWTPRELRHSFVSLLSDSGVPLEDIARLAGHSGTRVTELVYRKQIRPVLMECATAMDRIFATREDRSRKG